MDFLTYQLRKTESEAARQQYNYASSHLDLCGVRERLAELKSQCIPGLNADATPEERMRLYAAAYYVVVGRLFAGKEG